MHQVVKNIKGNMAANQNNSGLSKNNLDASTLWICIALVIGGQLFFNLLPLINAAVVADYGLSNSEIGILSGAEVSGVAIAAIITGLLLNSLDRSRYISIAILWMAAANILATLVEDFHSLLIIRFFAGLGAGVIQALALSYLGQSKDPDKMFGYLYAAVVGTAALGLFTLPFIIYHYGLDGIYIVIAVFTLAILPFIKNLKTTEQELTLQKKQNFILPKGSLALAGVFSWSVCIGIFWAYIERVGAISEISIEFVANVLAVSTLVGLPVSLMAAWLSKRIGRVRALYLSLTMIALALLSFMNELDHWMYSLFVFMNVSGWSLIGVYQLCIVAESDETPKSIAFIPAAQALGVMFGPFVGAYFATDTELSAVFGAAFIFFIIAAICFLKATQINNSKTGLATTHHF